MSSCQPLSVSCQSLASQGPVIHGNKSVVSLRAHFWDLDGRNIPPRTVNLGQRNLKFTAPIHFSSGLEDVKITRMKANPSLLLKSVVPAFGLTRLTFHAELRIVEGLLVTSDAGNKDNRRLIVTFGFSALVALAKTTPLVAAVEMGLVAHGTQAYCIQMNQVETHDAKRREFVCFNAARISHVRYAIPEESRFTSRVARRTFEKFKDEEARKRKRCLST